MERVAWSDALDHVAHRLQHIVARDGAKAVAFYLSGQMLTEDYYVANKLMKGFIGSANVDTNSRLCMASSVAGHRRGFGADTVPGCYEDLDEADLLVLVGSNAAWCHPVLFQRMIANKQNRGARMIVIDPRRTDTAEDAELFLGLKPGTDTALFSGLLVHLADNGALDRAYIEAHTTGFDEALARARSIAGSVAATALATGLSEADVATFFKMFRETERAVTMYSQGVNQSAQGTDKVNAILNCHLATGRIGKPGAGPFSLTGQPNAMGGREVGGLANQLAAHMNFTPPDIDRVRRFWKAPRIATHEGLKAVQMFEAIARGEIKALWVIGTNPAVSLPDADGVREALKKLELFVVSENVRSNDTVNSGAHVLLPALAWGEKSGTVTNSERRISRQRAFLPAPGEARPDWWILSEVAKRLGFGAAFDYKSAADVFREHAALSAFENNGSRDFDIGALKAVSDEGYDIMAPVLWPLREGAQSQARFFGEGGFYTGDRKARFIAPEIPALRTETHPGRPLRLNTGRIRDQWHTMTRTGLSPRLGAHLPEPYVEIHPDDAGRYRRRPTTALRASPPITASASSRSWSARGSSAACCSRRSTGTRPMRRPRASARWSRPSPIRSPASPRRSRRRCRSRLMNMCSAASCCRARSSRCRRACGGRARRSTGGYGYLFADNADLARWPSWLRAAVGGDIAEYRDFGGGVYRAASFSGDRIEACLFVGPAHDAGDWDVVKHLFAADAPQRRRAPHAAVGPLHRRRRQRGTRGLRLLRRRPRIDLRCDCSGANTAAEIGARLKAGTNCGSCIPELKRLIASMPVSPAPQQAAAAAN